MKGLTRYHCTSFICTAVIGFSIWTRYTVTGSCPTSHRKLTAITQPTTEYFADVFSSRQVNESCRWTITAAGEDNHVQLSFPFLQLKNSTKSGKGDCIQILDGDDESSITLDMLCDKVPQKSYTSGSKDMLVIYIRGQVQGFRSFNMTYSSISDLVMSTPPSQALTSSPQTSSETRESLLHYTLLPHLQPSSYRSRRSSSQPRTSSSSPQPQSLSSQPHTSSPRPQSSSSKLQTSSRPHSSSAMKTDQIIRIVGVLGAIIATIIVAYVVIKVTKCCLCLRNKDNNVSHVAGNSLRERARLAHALEPDGGNGRNMGIRYNNRDVSQPLSVSSNNITASLTAATEIEDAQESDTDSLQEMNELPPSYESLYLNELGEPVDPPKYSPPVHRSRHPPRRVNTFN